MVIANFKGGGVTPIISLNLCSGTSYMERLLRDGGDLDSMDRSLFDTDVSLIFSHVMVIFYTFLSFKHICDSRF